MAHLSGISQSPTDPDFVQNPYPFYARARELGEFVHWNDYAMPVATTHRAVSAVLKDRRLGRTPLTALEPPEHARAFYEIEANSMLELEPPRHTRLRGLVLKAFTSRRIATMEPEIAVLCDELINDFPDEPFDLLRHYGQKLPVIVIARLLGVPEEMCDQLLAWSNAMVAMYQARRTTQTEMDASAAARDFKAFLLDYIEERRLQPRDDLITELIAAEDAGAKLTEDEMVSTCILLLNAGHEATVHTLGNAVRAIVDTEAQAALVPESIGAAVEEALRFDPPLHFFTRFVYEEVDILGYSFQPGDQVGALLASANRDPTIWSNPEAFAPSRAPKTHSAFGAGIHFCVGAPLARLELQVGLARLFQRCPQLEIVEAPSYANLYHFHGLERLMVRR